MEQLPGLTLTCQFAQPNLQGYVVQYREYQCNPIHYAKLPVQCRVLQCSSLRYMFS